MAEVAEPKDSDVEMEEHKDHRPEMSGASFWTSEAAHLQVEISCPQSETWMEGHAQRS